MVFNNENVSENPYNEYKHKIRLPDKSYFDKLIENEEDYIQFKKKVMSDNTIDNLMKSVLLKSKKEQIENFIKKDVLNDKTLKKTLEINEFLKELDRKSLESKEFLNHKKYLLVKINNWIDGKINEIKLEFEMCWDIYQMIGKMKIDKITKSNLMKIFKPSDIEQYNNYVEVIEQSKKEHEKYLKKEKKIRIMDEDKINQLEEKKKKEIDDKKIDDRKKIEIESRKNIFSTLLINLKKLSLFDEETREIYREVEKPLEKYFNLETEKVQLNPSSFSKLSRFTDSVRISEHDKKILLSKFAY
jgi:hypothetical protein